MAYLKYKLVNDPDGTTHLHSLSHFTINDSRNGPLSFDGLGSVAGAIPIQLSKDDVEYLEVLSEFGVPLFTYNRNYGLN